MLPRSEKAIVEQFGVVDWNDFSTDRTKFDHDIFNAFKQNGLLFIKNAPLLDLRDGMEAAAKDFFDSPDYLKKKFAVAGNDNVGYHKPNKGDYKEFYHLDKYIRKALANNKNAPEFAQNQARVLKNSQRHFKTKAMQFTQKGITMGEALMGALERELALPENTLVEQTKQGNHIGRFLNYFAQDEKTAQEMAGLVRAKAHTDICALTFLIPSKVKGLQVLPKQNLATAFSTKAELQAIPDDQWVDVPYMENTIICNIGQSLSVKLNGLLPPTAHRVRNPDPIDAQNARIAMPVFFHFNENMTLDPLEETIARRNGVNLFQNAKNFTVKSYIEKQSEFDRDICCPDEHASKFLKEYLKIA